MKQELLRIAGAKVSENKNELLHDFFFHAFKGECSGILYENINEMQCIVDLLSGAVVPDTAYFFWDERWVNLRKRSALLRENVSVISLECQLYDNMTLAENLFVAHETPEQFFFRRKGVEAKIRHMLETFGLVIKPETKISTLSPFACRILELAKARLLGKKLVLLVNLTSFMSGAEIIKYFTIIQKLLRMGMSFVIIDNNVNAKLFFNFLQELHIVVHGRTVAVLDFEDCNEKKVNDIMLANLAEPGLSKPNGLGAGALSGEGWTLELKNVNTDFFSNINLSVRRGEIVAVHCMDSESYIHMRKLLVSGHKLKSGAMLLCGRRYRPWGAWDALKKKVCVIEENPTKTMLFGDQDLVFNCCINMIDKMIGPKLTGKYRNSISDTISELFDDADYRVPVASLAPSKQQMVVYCKWWLYMPNLLICLKPFSSADIHMDGVTKDMILRCSRKGISVLILSSDISDLHIMDVRKYLIKNGRMV